MEREKIDGLNGAMLGLKMSDAERARVLRALASPEAHEVLLKTREAAKALECHPKTLLAMGRAGKLNPVRRSKRFLRWRQSEVVHLAFEGI